MASVLKVDQIEPRTGKAVLIKTGLDTTNAYPSFVGQLVSFRLRRPTSPSFPFWNLSLPDQTIQSSMYPDYVSYLRSIRVETCSFVTVGSTVSISGAQATFTPALSSPFQIGTMLFFHASSQFRTIIASTSNSVYTLDEPFSGSSLVVSVLDQSQYLSSFSGSWSSQTFQLADNVQNRILLDSLTEDAYYQGAVLSGNTITPINNSNWMTLRWGTTDINITSINPTARQITIASGSPSGSTIELYPHRTLVSTEARHKQVEDSVLINNGMQVVNGLRLRDRMQEHRHNFTDSFFSAGGGAAVGGNAFWGTNSTQTSTTESPTSNTGSPRTGQFTRPRGLGVYFYEYMGVVNA